MKKKQNDDAKKAAELLQKLQAAVLSSSKKKQQDSPDRDEIAFQNKLASMLNRVTAGMEDGGSSSKKKKRTEKADPIPFSDREKEISELKTGEIPEESPLDACEEARNDEAQADGPEEETTKADVTAHADATEQPKKQARKKEKKEKKKTASPKKLKARAVLDASVDADLDTDEPTSETNATEVPMEDTPLEESLEKPLESLEEESPIAEESPEGTDLRDSHAPRSIRALTEDADGRAVANGRADLPSADEQSEKPKKQENPLRFLTEEPNAQAVEAEATECGTPSVEVEPVKPVTEAETVLPQEIKARKEELPAEENNRSPVQAETGALDRSKAEPIAKASEPIEPNEQSKPLRVRLKPSQPPHPKQPIERASQTPAQAPQGDRIRIQVAPAAPPKETPPTVRSDRKQNTPPKVPDRIVIPPRTADDAQRKDLMQKKSEQRKPQVTLPPSRAVQPVAEKSKKEEPIVVRPKSSAPNTEPIVIKPRREARDAEPTRVEPPSAKTAEERRTVPPKEPTQRESDERAQREPPPRKQPAEAKPKRTASGISLPRNATASDAPRAPKHPQTRRRPKSINRTPIAPLPQDENLDEVLDDLVTEELTVEMLPVEEPELVHATEKKSIFSRRKDKKAKQEEHSAPAASVIEKKTGLTEDDVAMIFELGYENELGRLVGYETLKKLKYEHVRRHRKVDPRHWRTAYGYRGQEYTGSQPKEKILAAFTRDRRTLLWRLIASVLLSLLLLPITVPALFADLLPSLALSSPSLLSGLSLVLLGAISLLHLRSIRAGLRSFFRFTPTPYSVNAILIPIALLYGLTSFCIALGGGSLPFSIAIPAALSLILIDVCDVLRVVGETRSFRILSAVGEKTVLDAAEPRKKKLRLGDKIVKIINDDAGQSLYRVRTADQTSGFFRRTNDFSSAAKPFAILISASLVLAFFSALASAIRFSSAIAALSGAALALVCSLPCGALYLYFHSLSLANCRLAKKNCTLVGEESVEEYREEKTVIFDDSDMYTAQRCTQISVREGEDFRRDMQLASILFRKMSGTLGSVGQNSPSKSAQDPSVAFVRLTENGTEAVVDNRYHLLAGNAAFMAKSGVRVPKESTDRAARRGENGSLMYVAVDGVLKLGYEIEYTVSENFEEMARLLADADTVTAIQTYDPNLNEEFLRTGRSPSAEYVRVIKPGRYEQNTPLEVVDTGAVALGHRFTVALPAVAASEIRAVRSLGYRLQLLFSFLGAATATAIALAVGVFPTGLGALLPVLYQILCTAGAYALTRVRMNNRLP